MQNDDVLRDVCSLELSPEAMQEMGEQTLAAAIQHIAALPDAPRSDLSDAAEYVKKLDDPHPPVSPSTFTDLLNFLTAQIIPKSINTAHPSYLGYIPGGGLYASALADFLASATNRYVGVWYAAPAAAKLEANALKWIAELMGFPSETRGIFTSGGSLANFSAIVAARKHHLGDDMGDGVMYMSDQTHHAVIKSAMLAGIRERHIRLLPSDERFRAEPRAIAEAMEADRKNGLRPFMIVGNAGTTNTGAVDPLGALADLAAESECWFHIDGAYGGCFHLCDTGRARLAGLSRADSLVLDPHKGLFVPYGTGCLLVRDGERLRRAHMLTADYLQDQYTPEGEWNFTEYSPELSRSFRGLRVWLPMKLYGIEAFRRNLEEKLQLTAWLQTRLEAEPHFECLPEPDLSVIAFRYNPERGDADTFNRRLLKRIVASGRLFLSSTLLRDKFVIRICILSYRTHLSEVEEALQVIVEAARELAAE